MSDRPSWDDQFAENEDERNARLATKRAVASGMFRDHSCWKCLDGKKACIVGNPRQCEYPQKLDLSVTVTGENYREWLI